MRFSIRASLLAAVVGVATLGVHGATRACSCLPPPPPRRAAAEAALVFEGRPGPAVAEGTRVKYRFFVERVFKGDHVPVVEILTANNSAACGRSFSPGERYLVYAYERGTGQFWDSICSRTKRSAQALADISELGPGTTAPPEEPSDDTAATEPPRINSPTPPPVAGSPARQRGCQLGALPHAPPPLLWAFAALLGIATIRRRP